MAKYCLNCGKEIPSRNKYCNHHCLHEYEYKQWVERWKNGEETGIRGEYLISVHLRRYIMEKYQYKCSKCGLGEENPYTHTIPLEVEHIDGGDTKDMNVITLFTTNHIELIEPTFLRGKRVGTIISMGPLDAETAEQFIRKSFEIGCYTILDDLTDVCKFIEASHIAPAFMAEIIEKVKSMMVLANQCEVKADDIKYSVQSYLRQVELSRTKDMSVTPEKKFVDSLLDILHLPKNEETMRRFIKMMEEHCDGSIDDYKD